MKQKKIDAIYAFNRSLQERDTRRVRELMRTLTSEGIIKQGWVTKQGVLFKTWKRRWFILTKIGRVVYLDNTPNARMVELKGEFWIDSTCVVSQGKDLDHIEIHTPTRKWVLRIMNTRQKNSWFKRFTKVVKSRGTRSRGLPDVTFLHVMAQNGVAYRNSPNLKDRISEIRGPELGDIVKVARLHDNWVQLDNGYWIPLKVGDVMTLRDTLPTIATATPSLCGSSFSAGTNWPPDEELMKSSFFNGRSLTGTSLPGVRPPDVSSHKLTAASAVSNWTMSSETISSTEENAEVKPEELAIATEAPDAGNAEATPEDKVPPNEDCDL